LILGYVSLALYYRAREAAGLLTCDCYQDCWCRKPGLSIFRWVFPRYHHNLGLTEEEKRMLKLLVLGRRGDEMAAELAITPETVRRHVQNILVKLGVHSRLEAATRSMRRDPPRDST
jgi:DNA-binding CsgD family transcriptional regulator